MGGAARHLALPMAFGLTVAAACGSSDNKRKERSDNQAGEGGADIAHPVTTEAGDAAGGEQSSAGERSRDGDESRGGEATGGEGTTMVPTATAGTNAAAGAASAAGGTSASAGGVGGNGGTTSTPVGEKFSFFITSESQLVKLAKDPNGFGGDLRYGEATGLAGADKICTEIAEVSKPGNLKQWRAFLSTTTVNAADRIGSGPWYDRLERLVANNLTDLLQDRPVGIDPAIKNDLPNEDSIPNHTPDPMKAAVSNSNVLTGSDATGKLFDATATCLDWTSNSTDNQVTGRPRVGFSWPSQTRTNWISGALEGGCGAGIQTAVHLAPDPANPIVGSGGGYGAFYCFALTP
jgi:hypothetical protein